MNNANKHLEQNRQYYNRTASRYDSDSRRENRNHYRKIIEILAHLSPVLVPGALLLEVGVGTGIHAGIVLERLPDIRYTAVDLSERMLAIARQRIVGKHGEIELVATNGEILPFPENTFDAVFVSGALHHFPHPEVGVAELIRVLKRKGRFSIMEPNLLYPTNFIPALAVKEDRNILQIHRWNLKRWLEKLPVCGVQTENILYLPPFPARLVHFYERVERVIGTVPFVKEFSIMLHVYGCKNV